MKIYLACTVRGDRGAVVALRTLCDRLDTDGHEVLTRHLLDDDVEAAERALRSQEVFERDLRWLDDCDVLIADASGSSYGVGFEVGYVLGRADRTGQRVVVVYRAERRDRISRLITGNSHARCRTVAYETAEEMVTAVREALVVSP